MKKYSIMCICAIIGSLVLIAIPMTTTSEDTSFYVEGYIYLEDEENPINNLTVTATLISAAVEMETTTDSYGYYQFDMAEFTGGYDQYDVAVIAPGSSQGMVAFAKPVTIWGDPDGEETGLLAIDFYLSPQNAIQVFHGSLTGQSVDHGQAPIAHNYWPAAFTDWECSVPPLNLNTLFSDATDDFVSSWSINDFYTQAHAYYPQLGQYTLWVDVAFSFAGENVMGSDSDIDYQYYELDPGDTYDTDPGLVITMSHDPGGTWTTFTYDIWGTWGYINAQNEHVYMYDIDYPGGEKTWSGMLRSP